MFGFTSGTDVGLAGERELELETDLAFHKRAGSYNAVRAERHLRVQSKQCIRNRRHALGAYDKISRVDGLANRTGANFDGLATKFNYVFVQRGPSSPIGLTVWIEPAWTRIDDAGKLNRGFSQRRGLFSIPNSSRIICSRRSTSSMRRKSRAILARRTGQEAPISASAALWPIAPRIQRHAWRRTRIFPRLQWVDVRNLRRQRPLFWPDLICSGQ